jgi:septum site-determining protein MinC
MLQNSPIQLSYQYNIKLALNSCKKAFWFCLIFSFFISVFTLATSIYSMQVLDRVLASNSIETLLYLTIIVLAFLVFLGILTQVRATIFLHVANWHDEIDVNTGYLYLTPAQVRRVVKLIEEAGKPLGVLFTQVPETQQAALSQGFLIKETPVLRPRRVVVAPAEPVTTQEPAENSVSSLANALFASVEGQTSDVDETTVLPMGIVEQQSQPSNITLECDVLESSSQSVSSDETPTEAIVQPTLESLPTQVIRGTLRSGRFIEFAGNLVVLGDVNTGAEVRAKGDIVIWGELKGLAHAGFKGSRAAEIRALGMDAVQLRIADIIARRPDRVSAQPAGEWLPSRTAEGAYFPEVARVVEKEIQIFTTKRQK